MYHFIVASLEFVLNMLAEATTTELSKVHNPQTFEENREIAKRGGKYANNARKEIEADTGKPVITAKKCNRIKSDSHRFN